MSLQRTDLTLEARTAQGPDRFQFTTTDGLCSTESFRTSELLLLDALWDREMDRLLCPQANYGVVGVVAAHAGSEVTMTETSARARNCCERNAAANNTTAATELVADLTALEDTFDAVAYAPREYTPLAVGKQRVVDAMAVLRPGATITLAASQQSGLNRYRSLLDTVATKVRTVSERGGVLVVEATRPQSFDPPAYVTHRTLNPTIEGASLSLVSVPGLFAASDLDDGTRLLAETAHLRDGERVLDLCCGYGALGTYAAAVADADVWLTDDDLLATRCANRSLAATGVDGRVVTGDGASAVADQCFDVILCNPPTHAGRGVLDDIFSEALTVLRTDGSLWVVHHRSLDLSEHLAEFSSAETVTGRREHVIRHLRR